MALFETVLKTNLKKPLMVQQLTGNLFTADKNGNMITVEVMDGDQPAVLSGGVIGYIIRSDEATVVVNGTLDGNKASIILPASAYVCIGTVSIVVKVGQTTVGACTSYVYRTTTDEIIDPGHEIPSLEELLAEIANTRAAGAYANEQGDYAKAEGDYAKSEGDTAKSKGNTAQSQGNTAAAQGNEAERQGNVAQQQGNTAQQQGATAASQGATAQQQGATAAQQGLTAQSQGNTAEAQGNEAERQGNVAQQQGLTAASQGNTAESKGNAAETKGTYAKDNGDYAKEQGDYAKEQGDYAKAKGEGIDIDTQTVKWALSDSGTVTPTTWQDSVPAIQRGKFLWSKTVTTFVSGDSITTYSVGYQGLNGGGSSWVENDTLFITNA